MMDDDDEFAELIERSSLGAPGAKALRARVSDERVADVMRRVDELDAHRCALPDEPRGVWMCPTCHVVYWADTFRWWRFNPRGST